MGYIVFIAVVALIGIIIAVIKASMITPDERKKFIDEQKKQRDEIEAKKILEKWGPISPAYICPHCQTKGFVRTIPIKRKKGISGAKATGALLTMGVSVLATGLSRKETMTQAHCENCNSTWDF